MTTSGGERFLCGVIEGFYGTPWSHKERLELFQKMLQMRMNSYMYAPKDDRKHRQRWRELYTESETRHLEELIHTARANGVEFVYAISPGLDISFTSKDDISALKSKLSQLKDMGCQSFALLFDDIDDTLSEADSVEFPSSANAQAHLTNLCYEHVAPTKHFFFCPTEYCNRRAVPNVLNSQYLQTVGQLLHPDIDVFWTGPKVISQEIPHLTIQELQQVLQRPPVIWDNLHANDYDMHRVFLGPYKGRAAELRNSLRGVMTNPNCQFQVNFVAMHTLAQWHQGDTEGTSYKPQVALQTALESWLKDMYSPSSDGDAEEEPSPLPEPEVHQKSTVQHRFERLQVDDLQLLADFYYLPYEYGPRALSVLDTARWLMEHAAKMRRRKKVLAEWCQRAQQFHELVDRFKVLCDRLNDVRKRRVLYELYPYVWDLRAVLCLLDSFFLWLKDVTTSSGGGANKPSFLREDPEAGCFRGGITEQLLRLLPLDESRDLFPPRSGSKMTMSWSESSSSSEADVETPSPPASTDLGLEDSTQTFVRTLRRPLVPVMLIRPYYKHAKDRQAVYELCRKLACWHAACDSLEEEKANGSLEEGQFHNKAWECAEAIEVSLTAAGLETLPGDRFVGTFLYHCSNNTFFVVENELGQVCGYAVAVERAELAWRQVQRKYGPNMRQKYPLKNNSGLESISHPLAKLLCERMVQWFHASIPALSGSSMVCTRGEMESSSNADLVFKDYPAFVTIDFLPSKDAPDWVEDLATYKRLLTCLFASLKANHIHGVHCRVARHEQSRLAHYKRMGFKEIAMDEMDNDTIYLGRFI